MKGSREGAAQGEMQMHSLIFDEQTCFECPTFDCLVRCQYMDINRDSAKLEIKKLLSGEDSFVLHDCVTCYACEEYCTRDNHPFYLITDLQEKKGIFPMPKPIIKQWVNIGIPTRRDIPQFWAATEPAISLCLFPEHLKSINEAKLFEDLSIIIGRHFFCQLAYLHFGKPSVIRERLPGIIENIANHNFKEVIFFHDECYATFTAYTAAYGIEVPFKPIHFFEYLYNKLKERQADITPLNVKVAYQRNCSSRLIPNTAHFVDDIFELIGAERVERNYDRENALCCAGIIRGQQRYELFVDAQKRNVEDMVKAEAEYCVFNCPMCYSALSEIAVKNGLTPIMMHELCLRALKGRK